MSKEDRVLAIVMLGLWMAFAFVLWNPTPREVYTASEMWYPAGLHDSTRWMADTASMRWRGDTVWLQATSDTLVWIVGDSLHGSGRRR